MVMGESGASLGNYAGGYAPAYAGAKLEGRRLGRKPLDLDRTEILRDRGRGMSLGELAAPTELRARPSAAF
jgi:hypothetical protein